MSFYWNYQHFETIIRAECNFWHENLTFEKLLAVCNIRSVLPYSFTYICIRFNSKKTATFLISEIWTEYLYSSIDLVPYHEKIILEFFYMFWIIITRAINGLKLTMRFKEAYINIFLKSPQWSRSKISQKFNFELETN